MTYKTIVIGASAGGLKALKTILTALPTNFKLPILIVQHLSPVTDNAWIDILNQACNLSIKEADEKEKITHGTAYIAPPNYHLLVEEDYTLTLSADKRVNYARPSIDVLFETAAYAFGKGLIGIILTGLNNDGSQGLKAIKENRGITIVQDPKSAENPQMPLSAMKATSIDYSLTLENIISLLLKIDNNS